MSISRSRAKRKFDQKKNEEYNNINARYLYIGYFALGIIIAGLTTFSVVSLFKPQQKSNIPEYGNFKNMKTQEVVSASWSDDHLDGKVTASGEVFNSKNFTAGHSTLPFGTKVMIKNIINNHIVYVIINDRTKQDNIVLSLRAAQALDLKADKQEVIIQFNLSNN